MNTFGLHTFAISTDWDVALIEPQVDRVKAHGVGLMEIPLLRPAERDTESARVFVERRGIELICSLGLPGHLDMIDRPAEALDFLVPAFEAARAVGSTALAGVTYGTIGHTSGAAATEREISGVCRFPEKAARRAGERGLRLGVEPCNRSETHLMNRGIDAARIMERVGAADEAGLKLANKA